MSCFIIKTLKNFYTLSFIYGILSKTCSTKIKHDVLQRLISSSISLYRRKEYNEDEKVTYIPPRHVFFWGGLFFFKKRDKFNKFVIQTIRLIRIFSLSFIEYLIFLKSFLFSFFFITLFIF